MEGVRFHRILLVPALLGLLAGAFAPRPTSAQTPDEEQVVDVRIEGVKNISEVKVRNQLRTRPGRPFRREMVESDARTLVSKGWFVDVRPLYKDVPGGKIVIFQVAERPVVRYVKYLGNTKVRDKTLAKEADMVIGAALDPYAVEDGRRKLEQWYHEHGFNRATVKVLEGNKPSDRGVVYVIHEGQMQRVWSVDFVGNTIASDARLKTQIESKPGILWVFKGYVDRAKIDEDIDRLTSYYRSLGFFRARVGRELDFDENGWLKLTFVIDEGPRYKVRNVSFIGNKTFETGQLREDTTLKPGEYFDQRKMNRDVGTIQDLYGSDGFVFADIQADPRFLEEPGQLDLVYDINEGSRYRVGRIKVHVSGQNPINRIQTVLNRVSFRTGDIVDIREIRGSERRLKSSQIFANNPMTGEVPRIVFSPPGSGDTQVARRANFRGQSPDAGRRVFPAPVPQFRRGEEAVDVHIHMPDEPANNQTQPAAQPDARSGAGMPRNLIQPVARRSNTGTNLQSTQTVRQARTHVQRPVPAANQQQSLSVVRSQSPGYGPANSAYAPPAAAQPAAGQPYYGGQAVGAVGPGSTGTYSAPTAAARTSPFSGPPVPANPGNVPARTYPPGGQPATGAGVPLYNTALPSGADGSVPLYVQPSDNPAYYETLPEIPFDIYVDPTQTGRFMFGVGVNSDAGVIGNVTIDEQDFDITRWPTSWRDFATGRAFRGRGQRFRLELAPGSQVQRYLVNFQEPYLFDTAVSLGLSGFFYDRRYVDWDEQRLGGRVSLGYQLTPDLSATLSYRGEKVNVHDPVSPRPQELTDVLGNNYLHGFRIGMKHDTRDSAFLATEGHLIEASYEQVIGTFTYPRAELDLRQYFLITERPDGSGRHVVSLTGRVGYSGPDTPLYDNFFAGGFSTIRGYSFRGAGPVKSGVSVGGEFLALSSVEYLFPLTADDMLRGVAFVDAGTVEEKVEINNFRVSPGVGLRITVPALGPAPIALDFAFPINSLATDDEQIFSFNVGFLR